MKVIHLPYCFYPDPVGGTEVYVAALAHELQARGVDVVIAAPGENNASYVHDGLWVHRFQVMQTVADVRDLYDDGDAAAADAFAGIMEDECPDVVHLHAFTRGVSVRLVHQVKRRGIPVIFTYHTPTVSCQRGTLMRWGTEVCDGVLHRHTCASCTLHSLGVSKSLSIALGRLPSRVGSFVASAGLSGGPWTALRMTDLVRLRHAAFQTLMGEVAHIVVLCRWTKALLLRNGIPVEKITVSRHGLPQMFATGDREREPPYTGLGALRISYLGRLDPTKGPDILIQAVRSLPEASLQLHLHGIVQGASGTSYLHQLKRLAGGDPRIAFLPAVPSAQVKSLLKDYHLLAVPSRWLETGPLVVLEAFAAGIPVIGSNLGGIAELVEHGVNGLLVEPNSPEAWCEALRRLSQSPELLVQLQAGIRPPRRMDSVAEEMLGLYRRVLQEKIVEYRDPEPVQKFNA